MEAKTKVMAAVAVIVMCAAGLVGAGYAYTATTANDGNSASTEYIQINQGGTGAYTFTGGGTTNIKWDTADYKNKADSKFYTDFTPNGVTPVTIESTDYLLAQVGSDFTLNFNQTGGTITDNLDCVVTAQGFTFDNTTGTVLFIKVATGASGADVTYMKLTANDTFKTYGTTWDQNSQFDVVKKADGYYLATVSVYYGIPAEPGYITVEHASGAAAVGPSGSPFTDATLIFRIATNGETAPTVTLDQDTLSLNVAGTETLTPTVANSDNKHVFWKTSDDSIATVSDAGVVTAVAPGIATITVYTADGHAIDTCTVTVKGIVLDMTSVTGKALNDVFTINATMFGTTVSDVAWTVSPAEYVEFATSGDHKSIADVTVKNISASTITATVTIDGAVYTATCTVNAA